MSELSQNNDKVDPRLLCRFFITKNEMMPMMIRRKERDKVRTTIKLVDESFGNGNLGEMVGVSVELWVGVSVDLWVVVFVVSDVFVGVVCAFVDFGSFVEFWVGGFDELWVGKSVGF